MYLKIPIYTQDQGVLKICSILQFQVPAVIVPYLPDLIAQVKPWVGFQMQLTILFSNIFQFPFFEGGLGVGHVKDKQIFFRSRKISSWISLLFLGECKMVRQQSWKFIVRQIVLVDSVIQINSSKDLLISIYIGSQKFGTNYLSKE